MLLVRELFITRVKPLQFYAGVGGSELPICLGVTLVAVFLPGGDFADQGLLVRDAAAQALGLQNAQFGCSHIQPAAMFRRIVPLEPFDQPACFGGGKGFVE